jgi:hypothetical protein
MNKTKYLPTLNFDPPPAAQAEAAARTYVVAVSEVTTPSAAARTYIVAVSEVTTPSAATTVESAAFRDEARRSHRCSRKHRAGLDDHSDRRDRLE